MNKVAILILALAISHTLGQTCDQSVKNYFSLLTAVETNPETTALTSAAKSCKSLVTKATCCKDAYFDNFGTQKDTLQTTLVNAAKTRDQAILDARKAVAGKMQDYASFLTAVANSKATLAKWIATAPDNTITTTQATNVKADIDKISPLFEDFYTKYNTYYTGFDTMRKNRATCFTEVLKTVVSSWCMACLTSTQRAAYGVTSDGTTVSAIAIGDTVQGRLAAACQPYFVASDQQSDILVVYQYAAGLAAKTTALNKIAASTPSTAGVTDYLAVTKTALPVAPSTIPAACTTTTCAWLATNVYPNALFNAAAQANLIRGGADDSANVRRRRLEEERQLQTGSKFEPATDEAVIAISFPEVVGDIKNTRELSALRVGVFSCIVAFFVALLI